MTIDLHGWRVTTSHAAEGKTPVAQWIEPWYRSQVVPGSNPGGGITFFCLYSALTL